MAMIELQCLGVGFQDPLFALCRMPCALFIGSVLSIVGCAQWPFYPPPPFCRHALSQKQVCMRFTKVIPPLPLPTLEHACMHTQTHTHTHSQYFIFSINSIVCLDACHFHWRNMHLSSAHCGAPREIRVVVHQDIAP